MTPSSARTEESTSHPSRLSARRCDSWAELLRERFNKPMAFADDGVEVLDPACGTGTYPLAVLQHAAEAVREWQGDGAVSGRVRELAGRLHAFEILVGPYAVAQLRLTQQLRELGVTDRNPLVYLTDTLESPNLQSQMGGVLYEDLTRERERARKVKRETRIFVCLGNPPYNREQRDEGHDDGRRKGGWIRYGDEDDDAQPVLEDFLAPVRDAGDGVHLKNLYNDYVYFWRWALWKVLDSDERRGHRHVHHRLFVPAWPRLFAGMRKKMREVFDELWIIDLEGDSLGARKTENVFAIRTPVAIAIGVRNSKPDHEHPACVRKVRLTGTEQEKLGALDAAEALTDFDWRECASDWDAPFMPYETGGYFDWPAVTDVFPWQHSACSSSERGLSARHQRCSPRDGGRSSNIPRRVELRCFGKRGIAPLMARTRASWGEPPTRPSRPSHGTPQHPLSPITLTGPSTANTSCAMQGWATEVAQPCIAPIVISRFM